MLIKSFITFILLFHISLARRRSNNDYYNFRNRCVKPITKSSGISVKGRGNWYCAGQSMFEDNFDTFDFDKWQHENTLAGGGNWEFQWYTNNRSNSFVKDGILHIRPTLTSDIYGEKFLTSGFLQLGGGSPADRCTNDLFYGCARQGTEKHIINPVRSARIRTIESFNFRYGTVEVRAKLPAGDWLWPAIWLLPKRNAYGGWPASGEIDLLESRGNRELVTDNGENIGVTQFGSTLHYGPDPSYNGWPQAHFTTNAPDGESFDKDFHVYKLTWTPDNFTFYLDNKQIGIIEGNNGFFEKGKFPKELDNPWENAQNPKMAPFDQEFYIVINLAVGGTNGYFPDSAKNPKRKPWENRSEQALTDFWNGRFDWLPTWNYYNKTKDDRDFQIDYVKVNAL